MSIFKYMVYTVFVNTNILQVFRVWIKGHTIYPRRSSKSNLSAMLQRYRRDWLEYSPAMNGVNGNARNV